MCSLEDLQEILKNYNDSKPLFMIEPPKNVLQRVDYESKKKFNIQLQVVKKENNTKIQVRNNTINQEVIKEEPISNKQEVTKEPTPNKYKASTLWEALLPWIDSMSPMFTITMKKEASDLFHQYVRDFLMGQHASQCGKPSAIRACLRAIDTTELKVAIDSVSFTVLAKLFNLLWKCNITLKEKQKEVINNFNETTTMIIEKSRDGWIIIK